MTVGMVVYTCSLSKEEATREKIGGAHDRLSLTFRCCTKANITSVSTCGLIGDTRVTRATSCTKEWPGPKLRVDWAVFAPKMVLPHLGIKTEPKLCLTNLHFVFYIHFLKLGWLNTPA